MDQGGYLDDSWGEEQQQTEGLNQARVLGPAAICREDIMAMYPGVAAPGDRAGPCCVPTLETTCLGVLALHLGQYLEQLEGGLSWLPAEWKAVLLAVARRRRSISDAVLLALADVAFTSLDLWGCGRLLSDKAIRAAACGMPQLQALDITGCVNVTGLTLRRVAACCPHLRLLRLGVAPVEEAAASVLPDILPKVVPVAEHDVEDSWEGLLDSAGVGPPSLAAPGIFSGHELGGQPRGQPSPVAGPSGAAWSGCSVAAGPGDSGRPGQRCALPAQRSSSSAQSVAAASVFGTGRLTELRWLIWPNAPHEVQQLVAVQCPKVQLNPMPASLSQAVANASRPGPGKAAPGMQGCAPLPRPFHSKPMGQKAGIGDASGREGNWDPLDPMCALDEPLAAMAGPAAWSGLSSGCASATPLALGCRSVAERFRQAYIEQAQRLRDKEQRSAEVLRRRRLRASPVLQALSHWLDEA